MSVDWGGMQSRATTDAADKSAEAIKYAADVQAKLQKDIYNDSISRQEPFYQQGISSLEDYAKMLKGGYNMKHHLPHNMNFSKALKP
jgi:hypothetical protein